MLTFGQTDEDKDVTGVNLKIRADGLEGEYVVVLLAQKVLAGLSRGLVVPVYIGYRVQQNRPKQALLWYRKVIRLMIIKGCVDRCVSFLSCHS